MFCHEVLKKKYLPLALEVYNRLFIESLGLMSVDKIKTNSLSHFFFNCMFYQLLRVQHSCSSTQSWSSVLPSIVETRDQNSQGCPLLFSNRNLGSFCAYVTEILHTHSLWEVVDHSRSKMHGTCLIIIHDPKIYPKYTRLGPHLCCHPSGSGRMRDVVMKLANLTWFTPTCVPL